MPTKKQEKDETIIVTEVHEGRVDAVLVGRSPLLLNRMAEKAKRELLFPSGRKTSADKAANMKHNPLEEFRASAHQLPIGPTLLGFQAAGVKRAIASAALDMPGSVSKAKIGRLAWVPGEILGVYGQPQIFMTVVRMADMNRTPDIRTFAIVPRWAIRVQVEFVEPLVNPTVILNLLIAAGMYIGIGDGRNEKGKLSYGQFQVMSTVQAEADPAVQKIFSEGRDAQLAALDNPEPYNDETGELLTWFDAEVKTRGKKLVAV
jgi:hypothetical protein